MPPQHDPLARSNLATCSHAHTHPGPLARPWAARTCRTTSQRAERYQRARAKRAAEAGGIETTARQMSHVIYCGHFSRCLKNVEIPTMHIRCVNESSMNYVRNYWAAAGPGRATSRRPTLQTSSNQCNSNRLTRTPVTNVVNPSQKTTIISEKALRLTTFVTTDQKSTRKTPRIDDVCNNTHQPTRQRHSAAGMEGAGGSGGHGRASRRGAERSEAA